MDSQLVKKFLAFYATQKFIAEFMRTYQIQIYPIHNFPPIFFKIHSGIILSSMPKSCK